MSVHHPRARAALTLLLLTSFPLIASAQIDPELMKAMEPRAIGPAGMSGRIGAIDAVASDPDIIWVGSATGGLWKSMDGGLTWTPMFDDQPVSGFGAVAIDQANPDVVWVGTGEDNVRNSVGVGNGVYRTRDSGRTWTHLGLAKSEHISRIVLDPRDPDVAWVAATGPLWSDGEERGVFKTEDGGRNWRKVLYTDQRTGCADLVIDPSNPDHLLAAMWEHRRWPWFFSSGGPGSGLHVTWDGGATWQKLGTEAGLPAGELGRIGLAWSRSRPDVVYALVEAKRNVLLRSEDGGFSWRTVNRDPGVHDRPFYYSEIRVDPVDHNRVYLLGSLVRVSNDGGRTLEVLLPYAIVHPDHHAIWIDPGDGRTIIEGNDGGIAISQDRGGSWRFVENLPLGQYYHVETDDEIPYHVYGGMQDNGSWQGPAYVWENGGIGNQYWAELGFGDGFHTVPDPLDATTGYAMSQQGYLIRWNLKTLEGKGIRPAGPEDDPLRFNWNSGFALDPFEPAAIYLGSQYLHRSRDRGESWETISGDLTTDAPAKQKAESSGGLTYDVTGAENHTTIFAIAPSPVQRGLIWVGTDDGNVQLTRDGGATWTNVVKNIKGLPDSSWVSHIEASPHDPAVAFITCDNHRRGDWTTWVFKTDNFGRTWKSLATPQVRGFAHVVIQDPVQPALLFLGTEFGLWFSRDGGVNWTQWTHGFPTVPVRDLTIQKREGDLVIGTHGRAAYILDDIRPLRGLDGAVMKETVHLFPIPDAYAVTIGQVGGYHFPGHAMFAGENRPYGASLSYWFLPPEKKEGGGAAAGADKVIITVRNAAGDTVRTLDGTMEKGVNRVVWDLNRNALDPETAIFGPGTGPEVLPGTYTVTVSCGSVSSQQPVIVHGDPRRPIPMADRQAKEAAFLRLEAMLGVMNKAQQGLQKMDGESETLLQRLGEAEKEKPGDEALKSLRTGLEAFRKEITALQERFAGDQTAQGIYRPADTIQNVVFAPLGSMGSTWDAPTPDERILMERAERSLAGGLESYNTLVRDTLPAIRQQAQAASLQWAQGMEPLSLPARVPPR